MTAADQYRVKAAELFTLLTKRGNPIVRANYEALAASYLRLAEQANRNSQADVVYEPPPERPHG